MNYWPLLGVVVVVIGFAVRINPALVVVIASFVSGLLAGVSVPDLLALVGNKFIASRNLLVLLLTLPTIGLLERAGLREQAQALIARMQRFTFAHLLLVYLGIRQLLSMLGLTGIAGHPQTVRPLLAPMAEGATEARYGKLSDAVRHKLRAFSAATDNVGLFFGEDIFVAFGAIVLMTTFLKEAGIVVEPMHVAVWGIPTAISAFLIHGFRLWLLDRKLARELDALTRNVAGEKA